eukprot:TRINITY_DN72915_c0_g1_i1.p1 TRINITY_DN72915_c0_g1~~TRINITY_DN72915_c0_g1_i1.p1  ORF type:complete len:800 (-),score=114.17 TRINITY_DN72915_c0_g1_i1:250-2649(-)
METVMETEYPMCSYGEWEEDGKQNRYFGRLTLLQKLVICLPTPFLMSLTAFRENIITALYQYDYPHASAGALTFMNSMEIMIDIPWDPVLASISDNFRTALFGHWFGRRRPFIVVGSLLCVAFSWLLVAPPMSLGGPPPDGGSGTGAHAYWRVVDCNENNCKPGAAPIQEAAAAAAVQNITLYSSGFISENAKISCSPMGSSTVMTCGRPVEPWVIQVRLKSNSSDSLGLQFSDDGNEWHNPKKLDMTFDDHQTGLMRTKAQYYTTLASALWYGIFNILACTIAQSMISIPLEAFFAEVTPDVSQRSILVLIKMTLAGPAMILSNLVMSSIMEGGGQDECERSPWSGCSRIAPGILLFGSAFLASIGFFCMCIQERPREAMPPAEATQSLAETFVSIWLNRPLKVLIFVSMVFAVADSLQTGAVLNLLYQKYVIDERLVEQKYGMNRFQVLAALALASIFAGTAGIVAYYMVVGRLGRFNTLRAQLLGCIVAQFSTVFVGPGDFPLMIALTCFSVFALAGLPITLSTFVMDIVDYDEFLTGQRREAQISFITPFFSKLAGLPTRVLPLIAINAFGYDPLAHHQRMEVIWTVRLCKSVFPALLFVPAVWLFSSSFPLRTDEQRDALRHGLEQHKKGLPAEDPLYAGQISMPVQVMTEAEIFRCGSHEVSFYNAAILRHFFPSELNDVRESGELEDLRMTPRRQAVAGAVLTALGLGAIGWSFQDVALASPDNPYADLVCSLGLLGFLVGALLLWFQGTRYFKALTAVEEADMQDVDAVLKMLVLDESDEEEDDGWEKVDY